MDLLFWTAIFFLVHFIICLSYLAVLFMYTFS
jgi:hypothetical protein